MRDHQHVVPAPYGRSIDDDHQEWLASGDPCVMCDQRRDVCPWCGGFNPSNGHLAIHLRDDAKREEAER